MGIHNDCGKNDKDEDEDLPLLVVNGGESSCNQLRVETVHFAGRPGHDHLVGHRGGGHGDDD